MISCGCSSRSRAVRSGRKIVARNDGVLSRDGEHAEYSSTHAIRYPEDASATAKKGGITKKHHAFRKKLLMSALP